MVGVAQIMKLTYQQMNILCGYGNIWFFTMIILQFQQLDVIAYSMNVKYIYDYVKK